MFADHRQIRRNTGDPSAVIKNTLIADGDDPRAGMDFGIRKHAGGELGGNASGAANEMGDNGLSGCHIGLQRQVIAAQSAVSSIWGSLGCRSAKIKYAVYSC